MLTIKQYSNGSFSYYSELKKKHINIPSELAKEILELGKLNDDEIEKLAFERRPNSKKLDDNIARNNWIAGVQWYRDKIKTAIQNTTK